MSHHDREPVLRSMAPDDEEGLARLERKVDFVLTSHDYWQQLWRNPTLAPDGSGPPAGFVLEDAGEIVGSFGSIPMRYAYGDETVMTASAKGVAIDPAYRGRRLGEKLTRAFFEQPGVDLLLSTTTNAMAGRLFLKLGASKVPQQDYDKALFWILRPSAFIAASLRKKGLPGFLAPASGAVAAPVLATEMILRRRGPRGTGAAIDAIDVDDIGPEFDDLWERKRRERKRLLAYRTSEHLAWHFEKPANKNVSKIFCCRKEGRLRGYAISARETIESIGLVRTQIVDVFVERDDPDVIDRLLAAAVEHARAEGSHLLEMIGFPRGIRDRLNAGRAYSRALPCCPYIYKAVREDLRSELLDEDRWYASPFDGDASLRGGGDAS